MVEFIIGIITFFWFSCALSYGKERLRRKRAEQGPEWEEFNNLLNKLDLYTHRVVELEKEREKRYRFAFRRRPGEFTIDVEKKQDMQVAVVQGRLNVDLRFFERMAPELAERILLDGATTLHRNCISETLKELKGRHRD